MKVSRTIYPEETGLKKDTTLNQWAYQDILKVKVNGRSIPLLGSIFGKDHTIIYAKEIPHGCFTYDECERTRIEQEVLEVHHSGYKDMKCKYGDGHLCHEVTWKEHYDYCGPLSDCLGQPIMIENKYTWYVGQDMYIAEWRVQADEEDYSYPEPKQEVQKLNKLGRRDTTPRSACDSRNSRQIDKERYNNNHKEKERCGVKLGKEKDCNGSETELCL